jgi:hypothetical protein
VGDVDQAARLDGIDEIVAPGTTINPAESSSVDRALDPAAGLTGPRAVEAEPRPPPACAELAGR